MRLVTVLDVEDFLEQYKPIENTYVPYPDNILKRTLGNIIWEKQEYNRIASQALSKTIWSILDKRLYYKIIPGIFLADPTLVGYIVTEVNYTANDIDNIEVLVNK